MSEGQGKGAGVRCHPGERNPARAERSPQNRMIDQHDCPMMQRVADPRQSKRERDDDQSGEEAV